MWSKASGGHQCLCTRSSGGIMPRGSKLYREGRGVLRDHRATAGAGQAVRRCLAIRGSTLRKYLCVGKEKHQSYSCLNTTCFGLKHTFSTQHHACVGEGPPPERSPDPDPRHTEVCGSPLVITTLMAGTRAAHHPRRCVLAPGSLRGSLAQRGTLCRHPRHRTQRTVLHTLEVT